MLLAVTHFDGEVFPHFGRTGSFRLYEIEDGVIRSSRTVDNGGFSHGSLADYLKGLGADALICGGIGTGARNRLEAAGIEVYPGVAGDADARAEEFAAGVLEYDPDIGCEEHGCTCRD